VGQGTRIDSLPHKSLRTWKDCPQNGRESAASLRLLDRSLALAMIAIASVMGTSYSSLDS
jgi:hypothetical protein